MDEGDGLKQHSSSSRRRDSKKSSRQQTIANEDIAAGNSSDSRHQALSQQLVENYLQYAEIMRKDLATSRKQQPPSLSRHVHPAEVHVDIAASEHKTSRDEKSKSSLCDEKRSSFKEKSDDDIKKSKASITCDEDRTSRKTSMPIEEHHRSSRKTSHPNEERHGQTDFAEPLSTKLSNGKSRLSDSAAVKESSKIDSFAKQKDRFSENNQMASQRKSSGKNDEVIESEANEPSSRQSTYASASLASSGEKEFLNFGENSIRVLPLSSQQQNITPPVATSPRKKSRSSKEDIKEQLSRDISSHLKELELRHLEEKERKKSRSSQSEKNKEPSSNDLRSHLEEFQLRHKEDLKIIKQCNLDIVVPEPQQHVSTKSNLVKSHAQDEQIIRAIRPPAKEIRTSTTRDRLSASRPSGSSEAESQPPALHYADSPEPDPFNFMASVKRKFQNQEMEFQKSSNERRTNENIASDSIALSEGPLSITLGSIRSSKNGDIKKSPSLNDDNSAKAEKVQNGSEKGRDRQQQSDTLHEQLVSSHKFYLSNILGLKCNYFVISKEIFRITKSLSLRRFVLST